MMKKYLNKTRSKPCESLATGRCSVKGSISGRGEDASRATGKKHCDTLKSLRLRRLESRDCAVVQGFGVRFGLQF